jgi:hypothetical protein
MTLFAPTPEAGRITGLSRIAWGVFDAARWSEVGAIIRTGDFSSRKKYLRRRA